MCQNRRVATAVLLSTLCLVSAAQLQATGEEKADRGPRSGEAGYGDLPTLGGPDSVARELEERDRAEGFRFELLHRWQRPYFDR